jgi:hypothetical protein
MDLNLDNPAVSLSGVGTGSATALEYLKDLAVKSQLRKITEARTVTVEDVVELTAAAQAALSSGGTAA